MQASADGYLTGLNAQMLSLQAQSTLSQTSQEAAERLDYHSESSNYRTREHSNVHLHHESHMQHKVRETKSLLGMAPSCAFQTLNNHR